MTEERINKFKINRNYPIEEEIEKGMRKNELNLKDLKESMKWSNTYVNEIPKRERRQEKAERNLRNKGPKHSKFDGKQPTQGISYKLNTKKYTPRHIMVKLLKAKKRDNIESNQRKMTHYIRGNHNEINA